MHHRFTAFPSALAAKAGNIRLGSDEVPAPLVHPDWRTRAPTLLWLDGLR